MASYKILLLIFATIFLVKGHPGCNHDKVDHPEPERLDVDEDMSVLQDQGRMLAGSYSNIRMQAFYDPLDNAPSSFKSYIQNELAPAVLSFFEGALRVKYPVVGKLRVDSNNICDVRTPDDLQNGIDADYAIIFNSDTQGGSTTATSRACTTASGTKRPLVATTVFNRNNFETANGDVLLHEKNIYVLIHEMMHTLAFSAMHYKNFLDANGNQREGIVKSTKLGGQTRTVIDIPELTQKLRNYYGCSSVPGIYMEDDGGSGTAGSHLERKFFLYETMCSGGIFGRRVSEFSLSFLEGSGWYIPNYDYAEPFFFGQGQGCDFLSDGSASKYDEYCSGNRGCANTGIGGGRCVSDAKTDGLKYIDPMEDLMCENNNGDDYARLPDLQVFGRGAGSKCFEGNLNTKKSDSATTFCFRYSCSGSGSNTELTVQVGNKNVVCDSEGEVSVDGYYGTINCPDPLKFCNTVGKRYCPRNCMGRGSCVNNKCVCRSGYSGVDCADRD